MNRQIKNVHLYYTLRADGYLYIFIQLPSFMKVSHLSKCVDTSFCKVLSYFCEYTFMSSFSLCTVIPSIA